MKHIIVIETVDAPEGRPMADWLQEFIVDLIDAQVTEAHGTCVIRGRFNERSAIATIHEMYGAPAWNPNDIPSV